MQFSKRKGDVMFKFITKPVPTRFVVIKGEEINADDLFCLLEEFCDDNDINDYNINQTIAEILVEEGVLYKHPGERMATLYAKTNKFNVFYDEYVDAYCKEE